jgi:ArsR family transcriptional regulator, arsenate/arsenite/antimonite-responsive transcriptional repressor
LTRIDVRRYIDTDQYDRGADPMLATRTNDTPPEGVGCCAPLAAPTLTATEAGATAELFRVLGDPARVRIVNLIATARGEVCACDINAALDLSQPTVSHHLKKLTKAGLLAREQRGKWAYFSLQRDAVEQLAAIADLKGACC